MKTINKIFTVSLIAIASVTTANAKIVSESMLGTGYSSSNTVKDDIAAKQTKLSGTSGSIVTYGASAGAVGAEYTVSKRANAGNDSTITQENTAIPTVSKVKELAADIAGDYVPAHQEGEVDKVLVTDNSGDVQAVKIVNKHVADNAAITTNKIGALTGYTKGTSSAALATTDTLNAALGKLENQIDVARNKIPSGGENASTYASIWVE